MAEMTSTEFVGFVPGFRWSKLGLGSVLFGLEVGLYCVSLLVGLALNGLARGVDYFYNRQLKTATVLQNLLLQEALLQNLIAIGSLQTEFMSKRDGFAPRPSLASNGFERVTNVNALGPATSVQSHSKADAFRPLRCSSQPASTSLGDSKATSCVKSASKASGYGPRSCPTNVHHPQSSMSPTIHHHPQSSIDTNGFVAGDYGNLV